MSPKLLAARVLTSLLSLLTVASSVSSMAQNVPDGATAPSGNSMAISLPVDLNSGNVVPSQFNYIRTYLPRVPVTTTTGMTLTGAASTTAVSTTYTDGFGDAIQTIQRRGSGGYPVRDLITPFDKRKSVVHFNFLPYAGPPNSKLQITPYTAQTSYYNNLFPNEGGATFSWDFQSTGWSAISHPAGKSGIANSFEASTDVYGQSDILQWNINFDGQPEYFGTYGSNELIQKKKTSPHGGESIEYYNSDGQLVCSRVNVATNQFDDTYYVYDDVGRLATTVTPKAIIAMGSGQLTPSMVRGLCYNYVYNNFGQVVEKSVPGLLYPEETVYDRKNRPVLFRSPLLRAQGKWQFTLYDNRDRPIITGQIADNNLRHVWQEDINTVQTPAAGTLLEAIINGISNMGAIYNYAYIYSIADAEVHAEYYYDFYDRHPDLAGRTFNGVYTSEFSILPESDYSGPYSHVQGLLTGKRVRVLSPSTGMSQWVVSVMFYDTKGRLLQTQTRNPWETSAWNTSTIQYGFSGNILNIVNDVNAWPGCDKTSTLTTTRNSYSTSTGLLQSVKHKTDNGQWQNLATYTYNDLRQIKSKSLGGGIETQQCDYRIDGKLTGMNRNYVENQLTTQSATFGYTLSYDYGFTQPRYDGVISGFTWRGAGAGSPKRAYGYDYDEAGRMVSADFVEYTPPPLMIGGTLSWNKDSHDYSVAGVTYDANGNMLTMKQRGVGLVNWMPQPVDMDDLTYTYSEPSNKLRTVSDAVPDDYNLTDFLDGYSGNLEDYLYDLNGNLTKDRNKGISEINYNHQDLPLSIFASTGTIENIYDAEGNLLQKTIAPANAATSVNRYWGGLVYKDNALQYFLHDEGRCRWLTGGPGKFEYDYFVKDHLGNVRTVVNAEAVDMREYLASMELAAANLENLIFEHIDDVRETSPDAIDPQNTKAAQLDGSDPARSVGTALLLKVMAGDRFKAKALSYYATDEEGSEEAAGAYSMLEAIVGALTGGATSSGGGEGGTADLINNLFSPSNYVDVYNALLDNTTDPTKPRAYLHYLVFDEEMQLVKEQSGAIQVGGSGNAWEVLENAELTVAQNGYLSIYVSNASYRRVYFDNVLLQHYRGRLLEEQHYYPHGLTIRGGSNTPLPNRHLYQGKELQDEIGLQLYDFHARQYDPQIGRFWGIDPADQYPSGYTGMGNDPANMIDPTGMLAGGAIDQGGGHTRNRFIANWSDYEYSNTEWGASWFDYYYNPAPVAGGGGSGFSNTSDDPAQGDGAPELGGGDQKGGSDASSGGVGLMAKYQAANDALDAMVYSSEIGSAAMGLVVAFNQNLNPLYAVIDGIHGVATGTDLLGQPVNKTLSAGGAILAAIPGVGFGKAVGRTATGLSTQGGLNLFKWGAPQTTKAAGWKAGDYMLQLPNKGTPALNWKANYGALRREMGLGKPIFDSYRLPNGNLKPTTGFLNAERSILQGRGWIYHPTRGAWLPPGF